MGAGLVPGAFFDPGILTVPAGHLVVAFPRLAVVLGKVLTGAAYLFFFHIAHLRIVIS